MTGSVIKHKGFIKKVSNNSLIVSVVNQSACSSCHAKGACSVADFQEKEIEIPCQNPKHLPGNEVTVLFRESAGFTALFYGYVLPFILVMLVLILVFETTGKEALAGLSALGILIPYYITLYFFRHYLKKVFKFELEEN